MNRGNSWATALTSGTVPVPMSKEDERTIALLEKLPIVATPILFCILYYRCCAAVLQKQAEKSRLWNCGLLPEK